MKNKTILVVMIFLVLSSLSCSLFNTVTSAVSGAADNSAAKVDDLWPDVPLMHGLEKADSSIPLPIRVALNAFISALGKDQGSMSFMAFSSTTRSTQEIMNYYNLDLMAQSGWDYPDQPGCQMGQNEETGEDLGAGCFYMKVNPDQKGSVLAIVIGEDPAMNRVSVFFVRFDGVDFSQVNE
jgi:hypothetical protein